MSFFSSNQSVQDNAVSSEAQALRKCSQTLKGGLTQKGEAEQNISDPHEVGLALEKTTLLFPVKFQFICFFYGVNVYFSRQKCEPKICCQIFNWH